MMFLSRAESSYLHQHLSVVRHVTLDPEGPGVLRIHLLPCKKARRNVPFVALLNGQDILPLSVSWAILLAGLMDALQPFEGKEITEDQWAGIAAQAVETAAAVYPKTAPDQIRADLNAMLTSFRALTAGQEPPVHVQPMDLGAYARYMAAPHRMDLMVSSMEKDGAWHCNQKCLHCYAANQPLGAVKELDTDQWLAVIQKCRAAGIPQLTFTGGEPTLRPDLPELVEAAQWFVTRLNTNGRMLTSALCRELADASLDSVQVTLYSADEAIHNTLVGAPGYADTISGIRNAVEAGLNVSINTPLCSLNQDYTATLALANSLGVRYATCSGLIPTGGAETGPSKATRLTPEALTAVLRPAMAYAEQNHMEINFTSPGWLPEEALRDMGLHLIPSCGACLSNMALAPDGTVLEHRDPVCKQQVIQPETSAVMREMMEAVVLYGGGRNAQIAGYRVGGKSGTSQKLDSADEKARIASFVAVAPIDDPQFLCLVCLDEPHSWTTAGGSLSAPVCAEVLEQTLVYRGVPRATEAPAASTAETAADLPADGDSFDGA